MSRRGLDGLQRRKKFVAALKALVGVFFQQLVQKRLVAGQVGRQFGNGRGDVHHRHREAVFGGVGHMAGQHLVEQHAQAVKVGAGVHRLAADLLGAHVARRADGQPGAGHDGVAAESFGDAEVGQHRAAVFAKQNVLGLDVAVDDVPAVGVLESASDGAADRQRVFQRQALADALLQRSARQVLHRQIIDIVMRADIVNGDDMRVVQLRDQPSFPRKPLREFFIGRQHRLDNFQGHMAVQGFLKGEIDDRHAALAQLTFDLIAWNAHV